MDWQATLQVGVHVLSAVVHVAGAVGAHEALVPRAVAHHHALGQGQSITSQTLMRNQLEIRIWMLN